MNAEFARDLVLMWSRVAPEAANFAVFFPDKLRDGPYQLQTRCDKTDPGEGATSALWSCSKTRPLMLAVITNAPTTVQSLTHAEDQCGFRFDDYLDRAFERLCLGADLPSIDNQYRVDREHEGKLVRASSITCLVRQPSYTPIKELEILRRLQTFLLALGASTWMRRVVAPRHE